MQRRADQEKSDGEEASCALDVDTCPPLNHQLSDVSRRMGSDKSVGPLRCCSLYNSHLAKQVGDDIEKSRCDRFGRHRILLS